MYELHPLAQGDRDRKPQQLGICQYEVRPRVRTLMDPQ